MDIFINKGTKRQRKIGQLFEKEGVFLKQVKASKHLFKKRNAYGIDASFFHNVLLPKNYFIEIYDIESGRYYGCDANTFKKNGFHYHFKDEEDHQAQIFLSLNYFKIIK